MSEQLNETFFEIRPDTTYRRHNRHILIATLESLVPKGYPLEPRIWAGGGTPDYTWGRVERFYAGLPVTQARHHTMPMHYYSEYLVEDYVAYVGCPQTNASWFLRQCVAAGALPPIFADAILVVLQENYAVEVTERRLWKVLAANLLTPLMRQFVIPRDRVLFFEKVAALDVVQSAAWPYHFRLPTFLDPLQLELYLKEFHKNA